MQLEQQLAGADVIGHPLCACGTTMWLLSIEPADCPGSDVRYFECQRCFNTHQVSVIFSGQHRLDREAG